MTHTLTPVLTDNWGDERAWTLQAYEDRGGYGALKDRIAGTPGGADQLASWPGTNLTGIDSPLLSVIGLVFGLGFVLSFGYWTTNFVEVQRAMASSSISSAQRAPIIGAFPKMFIPFIVIFPGMIAGVLVGQVAQAKATQDPSFDYNNSMLYLIRDLLPNGMLGIAITGLLAAFMAGMAANVSAFNTVFSYDLWETYIVKDRSDDYYLSVGRIATVGATVVAIGTALIVLYLPLIILMMFRPNLATKRIRAQVPKVASKVQSTLFSDF